MIMPAQVPSTGSPFAIASAIGSKRSFVRNRCDIVVLSPPGMHQGVECVELLGGSDRRRVDAQRTESILMSGERSLQRENADDHQPRSA